jgi:tRNA 2-selenouridine synthase
MAIEKIHIEQFLQLAKHYPVLDVRSPGEYRHAHIPDAYSLPLFTDEERKTIGTAYKQQSREAAIKIGLDYFGPKMRKMVEEVESLVFSRATATKNSGPPDSKTVLVHCWRGGMRSAGLAWLLDLYGFKVYTLVGGYKKFRQYVLQTFSLPYQFKIIGGYTGSGKTEVLKELQKQNESIIDLENLASHKGSAFGSLGMPQQPSQEMFENLLAVAIQTVSGQLQKSTNTNFYFNGFTGIWLEDESQRIGNVNIPQALWLTMKKTPVYFIDIPFEERLHHIVAWYGKQDKEKIINAITRIKKRLGGLETKTAVNYLVEDNVTESFRILLKYYDKWYLKGLQSRQSLNEQRVTINCNKVDAVTSAQIVLTYAGKPVLK